MKIAGVITEFNPFHNGHRYLLDEIRNQGYDYIVCAMSPNFVQRGDIAIYSKWTRCETALKNGADLVIEIPTPYALSSAENFAFVGVYLLNELNCIDALFFGSESGDITLLYSAQKVLKDKEFNKNLVENLKMGKSYPRAVSESFNFSLSSDESNLEDLLTPNNILGIEYINAAQKIGATFEIKTIKRAFIPHDADFAENNFASATFVRNVIKTYGLNIAQKYVPKTSFDHYNDKNIYDIDGFDRVILGVLRSKSSEYFHMIADTNEGLANGFFKSLQRAKNIEELIDNTKSKRYTRARIRRILFNSFIGIEKDMLKLPIPYIRILGMNKNGEKVLKRAKPLIPISPSLKKLENISLVAEKFAQIEVTASALFALFSKEENNIDFANSEYTKKVIKVD